MEKISIRSIRSAYPEGQEDALLQFALQYEGDERAGVRALCIKARKEATAIQKERGRILEMKQIENSFPLDERICGVDEAGRGPLAGPVAIGAVILPRDLILPGVDDSKKLSAKRRELLYDEILYSAIAYKVLLVSPEEIDRINIYQATKKGMLEAALSLQPLPDRILTDAMPLPNSPIPVQDYVKGDARVFAIAAASILAKVTRDRYMEEMDVLYPEYGFRSHKGYGSKEHIEAIRRHGPCPIHRRSFLHNILS